MWAGDTIRIREKMSSGQCQSEPVRDGQRMLQIESQRTKRQHRFVGGQRVAALKPTLSYEVAFARTPDPMVAARVSALLQGARNGIRQGLYNDKPGYIYVFHDLADAPNVVKIGRTTRAPTRRVSEWNRALAPATGGGTRRNVVLLFAYPTRANSFAERVVHETLRCQHLANRIGVVSGDEQSEFFRVDAIMPLKVFIRQTLAFVDALVSEEIQRL